MVWQTSVCVCGVWILLIIMKEMHTQDFVYVAF